MARGLGKGLDSLIPDFYDEDFDSNDAKSLEDMLNEEVDEVIVESDDDSQIEDDGIQDKPDDDKDSLNDVESDDVSKSVEDDDVKPVEVEDSVEPVEDESQDDESEPEILEDENDESQTPVEEDKTENVTDEESSEDISDIEDIEDDSSNPEKIKKQENIAEVIEIVDKNPRITLWSSQSAAVFRYLRKTEPEFSISKEASTLIDEAVSKKYPEIWELFDGL